MVFGAGWPRGRVYGGACPLRLLLSTSTKYAFHLGEQGIWPHPPPQQREWWHASECKGVKAFISAKVLSWEK